MIGARQEQERGREERPCARRYGNNGGAGAVSDRLQQECGSCGVCRQVCPFLETYGTPDTIIASRSADAFLCTTCGACDSVCPLDLSPSAALREAKTDLLKTGSVPPKVRTALRAARSYAHWGGHSPFSFYDAAETVFWPGCDLAAAGPDIITRTRKLLTRGLREPIGLAVDCCFDPAFQLGDLATAEQAAGRIRQRLARRGIRRVVTGCGNCAKIFTRFLPETPVMHVLEALPADAIMPSPAQEGVYLHHPCPSFRQDGLRQRTRELLRDRTQVAHEADLPLCCGLGGGIHKISPEMARRFTERVMQSAGTSAVVTSCMACTGRFREQGSEARHILELATATRAVHTSTGAGKWLRRLVLSLSRRLLRS